MIATVKVKLFGTIFLVINILFFSVHFIFSGVSGFLLAFGRFVPWWLNNLVGSICWPIIILYILLYIHKEIGRAYDELKVPKRFGVAILGGCSTSFLVRWILMTGLSINSIGFNVGCILLVILVFCLIAFGYIFDQIAGIGLLVGGFIGISLIVEAVNCIVAPLVVIVGILVLYPRKNLDAYF